MYQKNKNYLAEHIQVHVHNFFLREYSEEGPRCGKILLKKEKLKENCTNCQSREKRGLRYKQLIKERTKTRKKDLLPLLSEKMYYLLAHNFFNLSLKLNSFLLC